MPKRPIIHFLLLFAFTLATISRIAVAAPVIHHRLNVVLDPDGGDLRVTDTVSWSAASTAARFLLASGFRITRHEGVTVTGDGAAHLSLRVEPGRREFTVSYQGVLDGDRAQQFATLGPADAWYPRWPGAARVTFELNVQVPAGYRAISQGVGSDCDTSGVHRWREDHPQAGIHLVAGRLRCFSRRFGEIQALAYLLNDEPRLASTYLDATGRYIALYDELLGEYPYGKFALVENPRQTGFGMPSFTLLGSRVIRLPFIPYTSFPHEILHNWWGNGVYVDLARGNWSEGLTAYLADYALKERRGQGRDYRRDALLRVMNFVHSGRDFPLESFVSRHNRSSQAVGYNKSLMLFHMLRRRLGDDVFLHALREFYGRKRFQFASFDDLGDAFAEVSGEQLDDFFDQWLERTGAPVLAMDDVRVTPGAAGRFQLRLTLRQQQQAPPWRLAVPVRVSLAGENAAREIIVPFSSRRKLLNLKFGAQPLAVDVDPDFDLFRALDSTLLPPTLGTLFGAERRLIVLPANTTGHLAGAYRLLANALAGPNDTTTLDTALEALPERSTIWILGAENRFAGAARAALPEGFELTIAGAHLAAAGRAGDRVIGYVALATPDAARGLARKLPHYSKYGYTRFTGSAPDIQARGQWPLIEPALRWRARADVKSLPFHRASLLGDPP